MEKINKDLNLLVEDTVQHLVAKGKNMLNADDSKSIMTSDSAFGELITSLAEGLSAEDAADFELFGQNSREQFLKEGAMNANIYAFAPLQMTLIRSVLPRLIGRKVVNHEILKTPSEKYGVFKSYLIDHVGNRVEVAKIDSDSTLSNGYKTTTLDTSSAINNQDLFAELTTAEQAIDIKEIDRKVSVVEVTTTKYTTSAEDTPNGTNVAAASYEFQEDGVLAVVVSSVNDDASVTTDTIFAQVNYIDGTISITSSAGHVTAVKLKWRITNEHNNANTYEMEVEYEKDMVEVDSGKVINMALPYNYLEDVQALFSISGLAQATSMMADAQLVLEDRDIIEEVKDAVDGVAEQTLTWDYAYDAATAGISRMDHNLELIEKIHYALAMSDDKTQFNNVQEINIMCNPMDAAKVSSNALVNKGTYEGGVVNGQLNSNYKVGQMITPNGTVNLVSSRQIAKGGMYIVPKSANRDERIISNYSYSNVVFANNELRNSKDTLVRNMASLKRSVLKTYNGQAITKLAITNA